MSERDATPEACARGNYLGQECWYDIDGACIRCERPKPSVQPSEPEALTNEVAFDVGYGKGVMAERERIIGIIETQVGEYLQGTTFIAKDTLIAEIRGGHHE